MQKHKGGNAFNFDIDDDDQISVAPHLAPCTPQQVADLTAEPDAQDGRDDSAAVVSDNPADTLLCAPVSNQLRIRAPVKDVRGDNIEGMTIMPSGEKIPKHPPVPHLRPSGGGSSTEPAPPRPRSSLRLQGGWQS